MEHPIPEDQEVNYLSRFTRKASSRFRVKPHRLSQSKLWFCFAFLLMRCALLCCPINIIRTILGHTAGTYVSSIIKLAEMRFILLCPPTVSVVGLQNCRSSVPSALATSLALGSLQVRFKIHSIRLTDL
jgi:hypothetical protein